jgi:hypothetical protein
MKEKWANLTPKERGVWKANLKKAAQDRGGNGFIQYYKKLRPAKVKKVIEMMNNPIESTQPGDRYTVKGKSKKANPRLDGGEWMPRGTCTLIAAHHEMLKHDPERLSTEFIEKMCGVDCKCKISKKREKGDSM